MNLLEDLITQVQRWPVSVAMVVALSFAGIALKRMQFFPNRFIPSLLMLKGTLIYMFVGERGGISPGIPYPSVVLGLYGCILGMISWIAHGLIWKVIENKFPGLKNGDTQFLKKPDDADKLKDDKTKL